MLMELHHRTMAATLIQSAWRARAERAAFAPVWAAHQRAKAEAAAAVAIQKVRAPVEPDWRRDGNGCLLGWLLAFLGFRTRCRLADRRPCRPSPSPSFPTLPPQAWRAHAFRRQLQGRLEARAAIARHLPMLRARTALLRTRAAAVAMQRAWRLQAARRAAAATVLQAAARGWAARAAARARSAAAARIQAAWRGHAVRRAAGRTGRDARARLQAAAAAAETAPHKRIGARAREALKVLLASKQCSQVIAAVGAIEFSTRYSKECCALIADSGGVAALLAFMRSCNRSKPHAEMLRLALGVLHNVGRWRELAPALLAAPDAVAVLSERLQMFRDMEVGVGLGGGMMHGARAGLSKRLQMFRDMEVGGGRGGAGWGGGRVLRGAKGGRVCLGLARAPRLAPPAHPPSS
jgi:hypothetical protein